MSVEGVAHHHTLTHLDHVHEVGVSAKPLVHALLDHTCHVSINGRIYIVTKIILSIKHGL